MKKTLVLSLLFFATFIVYAQPRLGASYNESNVSSNAGFHIGYEVITRIGPWQPVYLRNFGFEDVILSDPSTWTLSGPLSEFEIDASAVADTLAPGDTTVLYIRFKPATVGTKCIEIAIPNNDMHSYNNPFVLKPCGSGADPDFSLDSGLEIPLGGSYTFYAVPVGYETYPVEFDIMAHGTSHGITLYNSPKIEKMSGNVEDFVIDESMTESFIHTYRTTKFTITFKPLTKGKKSMVVRIRNSDSDEGEFTFNVYAKTGNLHGNHGRMKYPLPEDQVDVEAEVEVEAFPNPSNRSFTIWTGGSTDETVSARVYNSTGIITEDHSWSGGKYEVVGEGWKAGLYLLEVHSSEGRKIIKLVKEQ